MDLAGLRSLVREVNFQTHGVPAVVTPPDADPVSTRIIWLTPTTESLPTGNEIRRADSRRVMAIRRDDVPTVPRGTVIEVTEHLLTSPATWKTDAMENVFSDHHRVVVVPYE